MYYQVGDILQSASALVRCFSEAVAIAGADGRMVATTNPKQLKPNTFNASSDKGGRLA